MIDPTTYQALKAYASDRSQNQVARELNIPQPTISDILALRHEHVGLRSENRVRARLSLPKLRPHIELLPNERIVRLRPPDLRDKRRCLHVSPALHARLKRQRGARTEEAFLTQLADLYDSQQERTDE